MASPISMRSIVLYSGDNILLKRKLKINGNSYKSESKNQEIMANLESGYFEDKGD